MLRLVRRKKKYILSEVNASTGEYYWKKEYDNAEFALKYAQDFMENNEVEYGLNLNIA